MTYAVHVRAAAERDIGRARDWYAIEAPGHVDLFDAELDRVMRWLAAQPLVPRVALAGARRMHLRVYPYDVWYLVHEREKLIEVVAVLHDRQDNDLARVRL